MFYLVLIHEAQTAKVLVRPQQDRIQQSILVCLGGRAQKIRCTSGTLSDTARPSVSILALISQAPYFEGSSTSVWLPETPSNANPQPIEKREIDLLKAQYRALLRSMKKGAPYTPFSDIVQETQRIIDAADKQDVVLRLFGGLAVRFHCPSATHRSLERKYADVDFMGLRKQSGKIKQLFVELGYTPREIFNALQGNKRLIFNDIENARRVDIFLEIFKMCHQFDFKDRLRVDKPTIPLADLLATKLQVVEMTEREYRDIIALVHDHEISDSDAAETINGAYLAKLAADDWGIYKTFSMSISHVLSALPQYGLETESQDFVRKRLQDLQARIEGVSKTLRWKLRAGVGEKARWYELPEQDKEVVDSRAPAKPS